MNINPKGIIDTPPSTFNIHRSISKYQKISANIVIMASVDGINRSIINRYL